MTALAKVISFPERRVDNEIWEPWIDEPALARHLGVSTRTIRRWRRDHGLPSRVVRGWCRTAWETA